MNHKIKRYPAIQNRRGSIAVWRVPVIPPDTVINSWVILMNNLVLVHSLQKEERLRSEGSPESVLIINASLIVDAPSITTLPALPAPTCSSCGFVRAPQLPGAFYPPMKGVIGKVIIADARPGVRSVFFCFADLLKFDLVTLPQRFQIWSDQSRFDLKLIMYFRRKPGFAWNDFANMGWRREIIYYNYFSRSVSMKSVSMMLLPSRPNSLMFFISWFHVLLKYQRKCIQGEFLLVCMCDI